MYKQCGCIITVIIDHIMSMMVTKHTSIHMHYYYQQMMGIIMMYTLQATLYCNFYCYYCYHCFIIIVLIIIIMIMDVNIMSDMMSIIIISIIKEAVPTG